LNWTFTSNSTSRKIFAGFSLSRSKISTAIGVASNHASFRSASSSIQATSIIFSFLLCALRVSLPAILSAVVLTKAEALTKAGLARRSFSEGGCATQNGVPRKNIFTFLPKFHLYVVSCRCERRAGARSLTFCGENRESGRAARQESVPPVSLVQPVRPSLACRRGGLVAPKRAARRRMR